ESVPRTRDPLNIQMFMDRRPLDLDADRTPIRADDGFLFSTYSTATSPPATGRRSKRASHELDIHLNIHMFMDRQHGSPTPAGADEHFLPFLGAHERATTPHVRIRVTWVD